MQFITGKKTDVRKGFIYNWRLNDSNEVEVVYAVCYGTQNSCGLQCCYKQPFDRMPTDAEKEKALLKYITTKGIENFFDGMVYYPNDGLKASYKREFENQIFYTK